MTDYHQAPLASSPPRGAGTRNVQRGVWFHGSPAFHGGPDRNIVRELLGVPCDGRTVASASWAMLCGKPFFTKIFVPPPSSQPSRLAPRQVSSSPIIPRDDDFTEAETDVTLTLSRLCFGRLATTAFVAQMLSAATPDACRTITSRKCDERVGRDAHPRQLWLVSRGRRETCGTSRCGSATPR